MLMFRWLKIVEHTTQNNSNGEEKKLMVWIDLKNLRTFSKLS